MNKKEFLKTLKEIMPENSDFLEDQSYDGYCFSVTWLLNDDTERPKKRSKAILPSIDRDVISDIENLTEQQKKKIQINLKSHLSKKLKQFDPTHNCPYNSEPPGERWNITFLDIGSDIL